MKSGHLKIVKRRKTIKNKKCLRDVAPTGRVCREPKHESYSSVANSRLPDWAYLQPKKPTSELGSLQCKSHLSCIHWIHTHPSDLSFASRWVVWPAGVNRCSSGGAAAGRPPSSPPSCPPSRHTSPPGSFLPLGCLADGSALSFYTPFLFYLFPPCFRSPLKSFQVYHVADTLIYEVDMD